MCSRKLRLIHPRSPEPWEGLQVVLRYSPRSVLKPPYLFATEGPHYLQIPPPIGPRYSEALHVQKCRSPLTFVAMGANGPSKFLSLNLVFDSSDFGAGNPTCWGSSFLRWPGCVWKWCIFFPQHGSFNLGTWWWNSTFRGNDGQSIFWQTDMTTINISIHQAWPAGAPCYQAAHHLR